VEVSAESGPPSSVLTTFKPAADSDSHDDSRSRSSRERILGKVHRALGRLPALVNGNRLFAVVLAVGAGLRVVSVLGFRPALWFNDSFEYVGVTMRFHAYLIRPDGYSAFLWLLEPLHSFALVAGIQHLMGLAIGVMIYALLRHWGVRPVLATLAAATELLDVHQIQLEHIVLSDTVFAFLTVCGLLLLAWTRQTSTMAAGLAGIAFAFACLTRVVGAPLIVVGVLYLLIRRSGWRPIVTFCTAAIVPLLAYASWFDSEHGSFNLTASDGVFLYSRVMAFANCGDIHPPARLAVLCDARPRARRPTSEQYIWHPSPLDHFGPGGETALPEQRFSTSRNPPAQQFAIDAIVAQPFTYLHTGLADFARSFTWSRTTYPNGKVVAEYNFLRHPLPIPDLVFVAGATTQADTTAYEGRLPNTKLVQPYADLVIDYQKFATVRGPFLAAFLIVGLLGLAAFWRRDERKMPLLLTWCVAVTLLIIPPFTAAFDYRYVEPAIPIAAAAAALALAVLVPWCSDRGMGIGISPGRLPEPGPDPR
jgi:hypothetical protein